MNAGIRVACWGMSIKDAYAQKSLSLPGKSSLENAYPARQLVTSCRAVTETATAELLTSILANGTLAHTAE